jgi:hypothetical protein
MKLASGEGQKGYFSPWNRIRPDTLGRIQTGLRVNPLCEELKKPSATQRVEYSGRAFFPQKDTSWVCLVCPACACLQPSCMICTRYAAQYP